MKRWQPVKLSAFDEKLVELTTLKNEVSQHLSHLNGLRVRYTDWFKRKRQTFIDAIKLIQISCPWAIPPVITSITKLRYTLELAQKIPRVGIPTRTLSTTINEYLDYWDELCCLKVTGQGIYEKVCAFCDSITRLRDPMLKVEIDNLQSQLNESCTEDFYFMDTHNEKHNLLFYNIAPQDFNFHGLLSFIPFLLRIATHICYWSTKLYIEKE
ncbi:hypothetical protein SNE40_016682 [Patella caerulea]|uniref:Uncharacterized protein n=1 Tax=Patella caerulea TaxID=87958 RepID=A0AAN8JDJ4_PATCE